MMPSCDQIGVPIHFHSSSTSGSAALMSLRILLRVCARQSPSSAILFEMSSDADWPWLAPDFFMLEVPGISHLQDTRGSSCKLKGLAYAILHRNCDIQIPHIGLFDLQIQDCRAVFLFHKMAGKIPVDFVIGQI